MGVFVKLEESTSEVEKEIRAAEPFTHPTWQYEYPTLSLSQYLPHEYEAACYVDEPHE